MNATTKATTPTALKDTKSRRHGPFWAICSTLIFLTALLALVASGYCYYLIHQQRLHLAAFSKKRFTQIEMRVNQMKKTIGTLNDAHQRLQSTLTNENTMNTKSLTQLSTIQEKLQSKLSAYENSPHINLNQDIFTLHILNAKLSLQLAEQSMRLNQPNRQIQHSLNLVRENLLPLGNMASPILTKLQQIAMSVSDLPTVDTDSLLTAINAQDKQLKTLKFKLPVGAQDVQVQTETKTKTKRHWQDYLKESWQTLKKFLVISPHSNVDKKLMTRASRLSALQAARLDLALARWGVVEGNAVRFKKGILLAKTKVLSTFQNNLQRRQWLTKIKLISAKSVGYPEVKLTAQMQQLRQMLTSLEQQTKT